MSAAASSARAAAAATPRIVLTSLLRHEGGTGVQSYVQTFEEHLRRSDRPFHFLNPFSSSSPLLIPVFGARYALRLLSRSGAVWWYRYWHARYLERALHDHLDATDEPAVIFAQCPVAAQVSLRTRREEPVVMAAHFNVSQADEWVGKAEIRGDGALFRSIRAVEEEVLSQLDGIVYISDFSARAVRERIPAAAAVPSVVIPSAVAPVAVDPAAEPVGDLVTIGSLEPRKNHAYLLEILHEAARLGRRYTLTVVGDGPERGRLEAQVRRLGLEGQVVFRGYQPAARTLLPGHSLYCHTAVLESFGIVLVEAMAAGLPVLAAPVGGIPEIVRPGVDGELWPLDDARAAAVVLVGLMDDPRRRAAMGAAARAHADESYSPAVVGDRLLRFLESVPVRPPGR